LAIGISPPWNTVPSMLRLIRGSQLAVLPDTTHMQVTRRADLLLPMLARFLE
jgi:hypothetical protein